MTLDVEKKPGSGPPIDPATAELIARSAKRTKRRLAVVGAVLVLAAGYLVFQGLGSSLNYFETVDQAVAQKASFAGKSLRLEGTVQPGTIRQIAGGVTFVADGTKDKVTVVNHGNPPQLFQPSIPVVVQGYFSGNTFISNQIIVDHTAQYTAQYPNRVKGSPKGSTK